jgi:hypothetical protein
VDCRYEDSRDGCIVTRTFTITATDKCGNQSTATVTYTWNEDTEPPVIVPPPGGDRGCNNPITCDEVLAQTTVTDNCPHEPPTVDCRYEDSRDGCIVTRTFTITATDKCGNQSTATVTYTWNEDTEPPVIATSRRRSGLQQSDHLRRGAGADHRHRQLSARATHGGLPV